MITDLDQHETNSYARAIADEMMAKTAASRRIELNGNDAATGLGRLAVAIVNLLHELLERQAIRRMENGTLSDDEVDQVGDCLMKQSEAIEQLCVAFGITKADLALDLGPLGKLV